MALLLSRSQRPQFKWRPAKFDQGDSITLPAPYGGLNLRDDINALKPNEARVLENWLPGTGQLEFRAGSTEHAVGMGTGEVKTVVGFLGYSTSKLLACANGKIFDVTNATYDPGNDTYTKAYLKFGGADGGVVMTDSNVGGSAHTWTAAGNANTDDAQAKFGTTSLACDGTGDYVTTADHADFTLGSGDFTVDGWFRCNAAGGTLQSIAGQRDAAATAASTSFRIRRTAGNIISAAVVQSTTSTTVDGTTQFTDAVNTGWHHFAFVRTGDVLKLFIDGVQEGGNVAFTGSVNNSSEVLGVGSEGAFVGNPWTGWIDEFRLSVGTARWTAAFTPPAVPYAPEELAIGFSLDRWQTANYSDRLFFVNGTDNPQVYNGTAVSGIVWSGSGLSADNDLVNVALVRNRLWFCEINKAHVWYGAIGQITAASPLTKFQLDQIASGGICMAVGSWSVADAGDGADDFTVFVMSTGEIIVYQGDPATTFSLVGKYKTAEPIGRQCTFKLGGELVIITRLGYLPVSAAVRQQPGKALVLSQIEPWGKIAPGVAEDAVMDAGNAGWHGCLHLGIVYGNVPQTEGSLSKQWVLNTRGANGGAWTQYIDWNGSSFCSFGGELYFGTMSGGKVMKATGATDDGSNVVALSHGAFVFPKNARRRNLFTAARPVIEAGGSVTGLIGVNTDFVIRQFTGETVALSEDTSTGSDWETSDWETTSWGSAGEPLAQWFSITGEGRAVSVSLRAEAGTTDVKWFSTDLLFKPGGIK